MSDQRFTAEELRTRHQRLENNMRAAVQELVSEFERETGMDCERIDVRTCALAIIGQPERTVIESVSVRVGLGR
jgi:hypothetical protein